MANIHSQTAKLSSLALSNFGEPVQIDGQSYTAIFDDQEVFTDTGAVRVITLTVADNVASLLSEQMIAVVRGKNYKIDRIPKVESNLVDMELKRA